MVAGLRGSSGLGVDAAADTGEECDGRGPHRKSRDHLDVNTGKPEKENANAEDAEAGHGKPHDGAAEEGDHKGLVLTAVLGGLGGAAVGPHGGVHADPAGGDGTAGADEVGDPGLPPELPR
jgi:hypothetical protein